MLLRLTCISLAACIAAQPLAGWAAEPRPVTPRGPLGAAEQATIDLFEAARGSVVFISTRRRVVDFWSRNIFEVPRGNGSGFFWDRQGHVVTNHHVIAGATSAEVRLSDGRSFDAELVGSSPAHDIAVLRVQLDGHPAQPLPLGRSAGLRVGQSVFAIGNPFGLDYTLTSGLVSALNRSLPAANGDIITQLIQTDAAINPGNSGGPLLDSAGRLIGINTAIYSPSGAYAGVGFAVPVDTVNRVVPQLIAYGRYQRPSLGVVSDDELSAIVARRFGVKGVLVLEVEPGSGADRAGVRGTRMRRNGDMVPGDVIVAVDGVPVDSLATLRAELDRKRDGQQVTLRLWFQGENREVRAQVSRQP